MSVKCGCYVRCVMLYFTDIMSCEVCPITYIALFNVHMIYVNATAPTHYFILTALTSDLKHSISTICKSGLRNIPSTANLDSEYHRYTNLREAGNL